MSSGKWRPFCFGLNMSKLVTWSGGNPTPEILLTNWSLYLKHWIQLHFQSKCKYRHSITWVWKYRLSSLFLGFIIKVRHKCSGFLAKRISDVENESMKWRHHDCRWSCTEYPNYALGLRFVGFSSGLIHMYLMWSISVSVIHDDVKKLKSFPRYWPFVKGIHRSPV